MWNYFNYLPLGLLLTTPLSAEPTEPLQTTTQIAEAHVESLKPTVFEPFTGKITRPRVRLRTQPHLESAIIRELNRGEFVSVVGQSDIFYAVTAPIGYKGYVFRTYILDNVVEGSNVNVRLEPRADAPVIAHLQSGQRVEGSICTTNHKWFEILVPAETRFYVAKDFVQRVGDAQFMANIDARKKQGLQQFHHLQQQIQTQLERPLSLIQWKEIHAQFDQFCTQYQDVQELVDLAEKHLHLAQDAYLQKKIEGGDLSATKVPSAHEDLSVSAPIGEMNDWTLEGENASSLPAEEVSFVNQETAPLGQHVTDKMRLWLPVEEEIYQKWCKVNPQATRSEFDADQQARAIHLEGFLEPYLHPAKNRPGDFILRNAQQVPIAYLYSPYVNLQEKVGHSVTLTVVERPNRHFAFPAYCVLNLN